MIDGKILKRPVKRIWILGDMHLGVRSNSMEWLEIQKDFYENEFIPNLKKNVKPGDILVGKVTPKSETSSSPEEKLLRSIYFLKVSYFCYYNMAIY